jgi:tetrapyrrole methylase family protein/MazG family protein
MKKKFEDVVRLSSFLRGPKGCPWDREQTLKTLRSFIVEEAYEVVQAIEEDDTEELKEELGDLLYQVVFASQICSEEGRFSVDDVVEQLYYKLIRRHPHVFGEESAKDAGEAVRKWHGEKLKEKTGEKGLLSIPRSMPTLIRAQRVGEKASHVGFDWRGIEEVMEKVEEELNELKSAIKQGDQDSMEKEWGDLIFSLVNLGRFLKLDAELCTHRAVDKFVDRFQRMEKKVKEMGKDICELSEEEMDKLWEEVKKEL